jgi:hypothetical protein
MIKTRVALLGALVLILVSGLASSTASAAGPYWRVNGARLGQGASKQINLQLKGRAALETKVGGIMTTVECETGISKGATIEGQGQFQGQDKGRLTLKKCIAALGATVCEVREPVTTNQLKSHLVTFNGGQKKYADLFEPTQGTSIVTIDLAGLKCGMEVKFTVTGSVAAEIIPAEVESQDLLLNFPLFGIKEVFLEQQAKRPELKVGAEKAEFIAAFGAKLESGERFGVWGT